MADEPCGSGILIRVTDKFGYRLVIYFFLVLLVLLLAFTVEFLLMRAGFSLTMHAIVNGLVDAFVVIVMLLFLELFLHERGRINQLKAEARICDNMLSAVVQTIPDLVYIKDAKGMHLMVNKAVEEFTGLTSDQLLGKTMEDLMPGGYAASCMQSDFEPIRTGKPCRIEERVMNATGVQILDTIKSPFLNSRGQSIGIVCVSRDITEKLKAEEERRRLQGQLQQVQKMEALGHLAAGVAHDFNNILTAIMGNTSLLKIKYPDEDFLIQKTNQILDASSRAKAIIKSLYTFSSKQKIETKPLNVNEVISAGRKLLLQFMNEQITIKTECCATPLMIMADQIQLERIFLNLATNAQDAMPEGGELVLSTGSYTMGDDFIRNYGYGVAGDYAHVTVADSGVGMTEEDTKKIFEPFFTTKEPGKGTGLGLPIVYGIVKQHNGFINVSSIPGCGTSFHVYLPLINGISEY